MPKTSAIQFDDLLVSRLHCLPFRMLSYVSAPCCFLSGVDEVVHPALFLTVNECASQKYNSNTVSQRMSFSKRRIVKQLNCNTANDDRNLKRRARNKTCSDSEPPKWLLWETAAERQDARIRDRRRPLADRNASRDPCSSRLFGDAGHVLCAFI